MDDRDYMNYASHFTTLEPLLQLPDVVIHLTTSVDNAMERIKQRGRTSEKAIDADYLKALTGLFDEWTDSVKERTKVVKLDWNTFQPADEVVKKIEKQLKIQLPLPVVPSAAA
jgi:deoxyadenosine/deoxycytidine kinase